MEEGKMLGKGISFPPRLGTDSRMAWSSGAQNIRESIRIILMTEPQERLMLPDFGGGLKVFLFKPNTAGTHRMIEDRVTHSLQRWEPRISIESVNVKKDDTDEQSAIITINYSLIATGTSDQMNITLKLTE